MATSHVIGRPFVHLCLLQLGHMSLLASAGILVYVNETPFFPNTEACLCPLLCISVPMCEFIYVCLFIDTYVISYVVHENVGMCVFSTRLPSLGERGCGMPCIGQAGCLLGSVYT